MKRLCIMLCLFSMFLCGCLHPNYLPADVRDKIMSGDYVRQAYPLSEHANLHVLYDKETVISTRGSDDIALVTFDNKATTTVSIKQVNNQTLLFEEIKHPMLAVLGDVSESFEKYCTTSYGDPVSCYFADGSYYDAIPIYYYYESEDNSLMLPCITYAFNFDRNERLCFTFIYSNLESSMKASDILLNIDTDTEALQKSLSIAMEDLAKHVACMFSHIYTSEGFSEVHEFE